MVLSADASRGPSSSQDVTTILSFNFIAMAIMWLRLILYVAAFFGVILIQLHQGDFLNVQIWQPFYILMIVTFAAHVGLVESARSEERMRTVLGTMFLLDGAMIPLIMWMLGSHHSLFLFLILTNCALAALSLGLPFGLKCALWSVSCLNLHLGLNSWFNPENMQASWFVDNLSVFVVTGVSGVLGDQIQFVTKDIAQKREEIEALTDINDLIVENISSGLLFVDSEFKIVRANRGAARLFGDLGLEGRALEEVFADLKQFVAIYALKAHDEPYERVELNYYNYKKEQSIFEVIISVVRQNFASGPTAKLHRQFVLLIQNVTEIKNLQFALSQKEKLAAVGQLAAGIAHEIRNPLASISGSIQLLQANLTTQTSDDTKLFKIVIKEIDRLNNLISEFLDFVRPGVRIEDPIQINDMAKEVLAMARVNTKLNQKVEQRTELRATKGLYGHYDKLKQALLNIIINAYQATGDTLRPEVFVRTYDQDDAVVLEIQDNGVGISRDNLRRVFEPFHTTKAGGTGLGLAITHKIIESHGAQIRVESELGKGAKFIIVFNSSSREHQSRGASK